MTWTPEEITQKLDAIRSLPAGELAGWWRYIHGWRAPFPGEVFALQQRAQRLGVTLSSPAAPSDTTIATAPPLTGSLPPMPS